MKKIIYCLGFFLILCVSLSAKWEIYCKLEKVVREPALSKEGTIVDGKIFTDENLSIVWVPAPSQFGFVLSNTTNSSLSIIWDECSLITSSGETHKIMHSGMKYIDRNNAQTPTIIPLQAKLSDIFFPTDYVYFVTGQYGGWRSSDIFPGKMKDKEFEKIKGQDITFRTIMVLKKGEEKFTYHFFFKEYAKQI